MGKKKKRKKGAGINIEEWTEEQYEEYLKGLYGMEYIAGYTDGGMPYGIFCDEDDDVEFDSTDSMSDSDEGIPF
ncbi:MAG: hypothetical protein ACQEP4_01380 [Bacillota bacterium]